MNRATFWTFMAPLLAMSILLAVLGTVAAWNIQNQQVQTSKQIGAEVQEMVAIHSLYMVIRDVRFELNQFLRLGGDDRLKNVRLMTANASALLAQSLAMGGPSKYEPLRSVQDSLHQFVEELAAADQLPEPRRRRILEEWADTRITEAILKPAEESLRLHERAVVNTAEANQKTTSQMMRGFLFVGVAVCGAGVFLGLTIARSVQRSLWELHVSVTGAAGKLERIEGPFPGPPHGGLSELSLGAKFLETRVAQVVEQLQQREREVLRNEQLAAVGKLAAGLAHELRNPLMPIKMLVQEALARSGDGGLRGRQLTIVDEEICRMEASIQAFLDFAKPPELEKRRKDLRSIVQEAVELVQGLTRSENVAISCQLTDEPCELDIDSTQIKQVLLNLLLNAMDAAGPEGRIAVVVEQNGGAGNESRNIPSPRQPGVWLKVRDNGPGIPPDLLPHIFDPFVTHKEFGTGLGLTICRRIIEAHEGTIEAVASPNAETEFRIWLPTELNADDASVAKGKVLES